jgi:plasmid maintenance system antidote protein VapI
MSATIVKLNRAAISNRGTRVAARGGRPAARGWGQVVRLADGTATWPTGGRRGPFRFDDPIDEQLRHGIAWSDNSSGELARAAGISTATIDRFMRGADVLTIGQAARLARLLGLRLEDQATIDGLLAIWQRAGEPVIRCPRNRLAASRRR